MENEAYLQRPARTRTPPSSPSTSCSEGAEPPRPTGSSDGGKEDVIYDLLTSVDQSEDGCYLCGRGHRAPPQRAAVEGGVADIRGDARRIREQILARLRPTGRMRARRLKQEVNISMGAGSHDQSINTLTEICRFIFIVD